jgi:hypothetical protein
MAISPNVIRGGIVLLDPGSGQVQRVITLQYNPDTLTRSFQIRGAGGEAGDHVEALRLKGPPVETIKLEAEIDAADQMERADPLTGELGIHPQLAALETMVYPGSAQLRANDSEAGSGSLEIAPMEASLMLFVWSKNRILPVRLTEFSITEEAFGVTLCPIRAKVNFGLRVLTVDDVGFDHRGGGLFMAYLQHKEQLAQRNVGGSLDRLGIGGIA